MNKGQVMLLTVLILSGTVLAATTIAGLLTLFQIRQSSNISNSTAAIYAADSGIEYELYKFKEPTYPEPQFTNNALLDSFCDIDPTTGDAFIQSTGEVRDVIRAFRADLAGTTECP